MTRATARFATAGALSALLLSTLGGLTAERSSGMNPSPAKVGPGEQVSVTATVPVTARGKVGGKRISRKIARPTRLQKLTSTGWQSSARRSASRSGQVSYTFSAPTTTARYRIIAPAHRVKLTHKAPGRKAPTKVVLRAWTGPARTIAVTAAPTQPPTQTPTETPSQRPTQTPTQSPTEPPTPRLSLLTSRSDRPAPDVYTQEVSMDGAGEVVAFTSKAPDLVDDDDNGQGDVFVADTRTGTVELVSRALNGSSANQSSQHPDISPDGRYVTFASRASDIVPGVSEGYQQIYLYDRVTHETELVSVTAAGIPGDDSSMSPSVSKDGKFVAFSTFAVNLSVDFPGYPKLWHAVRYERSTGVHRIATWPRDGHWVGDSLVPSLSDDGSRVAFVSANDALVADDDNGRTDVFLYDFNTSVRQMVSRQPDGTGLRSRSSSPLISGDGNVVLWQTDDRSVTVGDDNGAEDTFRFDVARRRNSLMSRGSDGRSLDGHSGPVAVDADGSHVLLSSTWQTGGTGPSLYLANVESSVLRPLGVGPDGAPYHSTVGALDASGHRVTFSSTSPLTPDDTATGSDVYFWQSGV